MGTNKGITFRTPAEALPEAGSKALLCTQSIRTYEAGYIYDGTNFRRHVMEDGDIVPVDRIVAWAYESDFYASR